MTIAVSVAALTKINVAILQDRIAIIGCSRPSQSRAHRSRDSISRGHQVCGHCGLPVQCEKPAVAIGADRAINRLAPVRRLELDTFVATLLAFRVVLIRHRLLRYLDYCGSRVRSSIEEGRSSDSAEYSPQ